MATGKVTEPSSGCVVLRVKRKREEDPAEALVVAKQSKLDTGSSSLFHFVGTVKEDDSDRVILDRLKHHKDRLELVKPNPLARLSLEDTRIKNRDRMQNFKYGVTERPRGDREATCFYLLLIDLFLNIMDNLFTKDTAVFLAQSSVQRFKVTSQLRCLEDGGESVKEESEGAVAASSSGHDIGRRVHICDVNQDNLTTSHGSTETSGAVTCNNSVMLRERVHQDSGYVYDLYLTRQPGILDMESATFDWSSLSVYGSELVHDIIDDEEEEKCDDEDDSNDEDNWRNDYPDEEGSDHWSGSDEYDPYQDSYRDRPALYCSSGDEYDYNDYL